MNRKDSKDSTDKHLYALHCSVDSGVAVGLLWGAGSCLYWVVILSWKGLKQGRPNWVE